MNSYLEALANEVHYEGHLGNTQEREKKSTCANRRVFHSSSC